MSKRRLKIESSSLELLLDTMCNTFGGVMFIAISLLLIISVMTKDIPQENEETADTVTLQQEIESLQKIYSELLKELQLKAEQIKLQQSSNRQEKYQELLMLMQLVKEIKLKIEAAELADKTLTLSLSKLSKSVADLRKQTALQEDKIEFLQRKLLDLEEKLSKLKAEDEAAPLLAFRIMERSDRAPFFLMLHGDKVYPVGPWVSDGNTDQIDNAVNANSYQHNNSQVISCTVKPGSGITVLAGDNFSPQFQELLNKIPAGRVPKFFITPGSAPTAYKMREIMKKCNIYHGTVLAPADDTPFMFKFDSNAKYEY